MVIECLVLGAGQEVGKSCVVVTINGKRIMFDCGMHMGYLDHRRYPDFSLISKSHDFTRSLSCIIITHFHLDHIGALPYFTQVCGYNGPIYMTYPTKALAPLMLEDYRKVMVDRRGEEEQFSSEHIVECMKKVTAVDLKQTIQVDEDLQIRAYYAGHELCMLLDDYWERMNLKVPIYFSAGLTIQANMYYKVLINWTSQKVKDTYATRNAFDFKNVLSFDRSLINAPGACVLFATPGMISGGFSLEVFKQWAPCEKNLVTLPGYCVAGTVGHKLMSAKIPTQIRLDEDVQINVRCQIHQLSFSPHTDAKGIMDLVKFLSPKHVILVHGEKPKMVTLKEKIQSELGIQCYLPANSESLCIPTTHHIKAGASDAFVRSCLSPNFKFLKTNSAELDDSHKRTMPLLQVYDDRVSEGILTLQKNQSPKVVNQNEFMEALGVEKHEVKLAHCFRVYIPDSESGDASDCLPSTSRKGSLLHLISEKLCRELPDFDVQDCQEHIQIQSVVVSFCSNEKCPHRTGVSLQSVDKKEVHFCCSWSVADDALAWRIVASIKNLELDT
ncbi:UNVERIFIED_CONTAM: Cleavage and polyadenylation specificity factor subunit 3-II [Sesamum indicum]